MNKLKSRTRNIEEAFSRSADPARDTFFRKLRASLLAVKEKHIVFLDKNHPPNAIP
jgi:hypothetical protein